MVNMGHHWDKRFLQLASNIAQWSKDPSRQIGAVAIGENRQVLATGYNGFPRGIYDTDERLTDRSEKYKFMVHAEMNCIYNATQNGVSLNDAHLYVYGLPVCHECAKGIVQVGISRVVMPDDVWVLDENIENDKKWIDSWRLTKQIFTEGNVVVNTIKL